jgi:hypothetical protein
MDSLSIPIKGDQTLEVSKEQIEALRDSIDGIDLAIWAIALEVIANRRMTPKALGGTGLTKLKGEALEDAKAKAMSIATENIKKLFDSGDVGGTKGKAKKTDSKVPLKVLNQAKAMAKAAVKDYIKSKGKKIRDVLPAVITKTANDMVASDPKWIREAQALIDARDNQVATSDSAILAMLGSIEEDPDRAAKNKAKNKTSRGTKAKADVSLPKVEFAKGQVPPSRRPENRPN